MNPTLFAQMKSTAEATVKEEFAAIAAAAPVDLSDENRTRMLCSATGLGSLVGWSIISSRIISDTILL